MKNLKIYDAGSIMMNKKNLPIKSKELKLNKNESKLYKMNRVNFQKCKEINFNNELTLSECNEQY